MDQGPPPVNHVLHLLLSIVTCGLWLPVWALLSWLHARDVDRVARGLVPREVPPDRLPDPRYWHRD